MNGTIGALILVSAGLLAALPASAGDFEYWLNMAKETKDEVQSIEYYRKAIDSWETADGVVEKAKAYSDLSWKHYNRKEWDSAIAAATRSIELDAANWLPFHFRGWSHYFKKDYKKSGDDHAKTAELNATDPYLVFSVAICRMMEGKPRASLEESQRALKVKEDFPFAHAQIGFSRFELGEYREAVAAFNKAVELDAKDASPHVGLALARWKLGEKAEAKSEYGKALSLAPDLNAISIWMNATRRYTPKQRQTLAEIRKAL